MRKITTRIEINKEYLHFAAAHFTIFDESTRENLHGHNFQVALNATAEIGDDGLTFDYNILKHALKSLCDELDEQVLMPTQSPHLNIHHGDDYVFVEYADERIPFLERDLTLLPLRNITVEELAQYFLDRLRGLPEISSLSIRQLELRCASGDGQWAVATFPPTN
ncbi:MAG: 6-pyruvoyltetrahydropterin/6-carboxytetrahydropterin synthase [Limisphaerales bacterium]|jgi:6-pyruvoyltetrahydropterin/6-carboxytetrahydropterin synthase